MNRERYRGVWLALLLLWPWPIALSAGNAEIVLVKSSDNEYFDRSIEALVSHVKRDARFEVVLASELATRFASPAPSRLYVGFGLAAARAIERQDDDAGAFDAYLTHEQMLELAPGKQVHVLLDQPLYRYLAFTRLLLGTDSIGIVSDVPVTPGKKEQRLLMELDMTLNQYRVDERHKLLPLLRNLLQQNDALLMLPRQSIYNRDSLKGVLLTSYRYRKPVISYSPAHVRAGALASIYSSPSDIGRHLAMLVERRLEDPSWQGPSFEYARFYSIAINRRVARSLNLDLPDEDEIRLQLQRAAP